MKTKTLKKNKVNVITLGCSKNMVDSEVLMAQLLANGIEVEHESKDDESQIIIVNTCGFIDNAKQESIDTILRYAEAKDSKLIEKLYVTGCLSERYREDLALEIPQVDAFFGTRELPALLKKFKADYKHELVGERLLTSPSHFAYFKISEGCDRPCSFCAIPLMRGNHISRPIEELVKEAQLVASKGVKELILIAQDLTFYGLDLYKNRQLDELLKQLSQVNGIEWIRLQYAYPSGFPVEILKTIRETPNICNYLDMPLQHASDNMLKLMRRGTTRQKTTDLVNLIRDEVPDIAIRTTMIVGHPGETKKDFEELQDFVQEMKFERLGVFGYSHEEKTHAGDTMEDTISATIKRNRAASIMEIQQVISEKNNEKHLDKTMKVLFDRKEGDFFIGRTEYDSPEVDNEVLVDATNQYVRVGDFANVKITDTAEFDLYGEII